ncbi:Telomerase Cajal body protein 1 [Intoshia linei]|uniref:WD repeat-containing protein 79 n=1 Tax=Intoshia linei TaxID=1819745 RepID=A0A177AWS1_9BILA|nr:Telomerase Cajal body protein 1 [Intoshia linei]
MINEIDNFETNNCIVNYARGTYESADLNNYLRGCKWYSKDFNYISTNSNDHKIRIFEYTSDDKREMEPIFEIFEPQPIYDFEWCLNEPILMTTSRYGPVHCWDLKSDSPILTFSERCHQDTILSAYSLKSSNSFGYCGYNGFISLVDFETGKNREKRILKEVTNCKMTIISSINVNPAMNSVYACGSYTGNICLFAEPDGTFICGFGEYSSGISQIKFSDDGLVIYTCARKDDRIIAWDLRNPKTFWNVFNRNSTTNQTIGFDIFGDKLVSGSTDGYVHLWSQNKEMYKKRKICQTVVNDVSFHPSLEIISCSTGNRAKMMFIESDSETETENSTENVCIKCKQKINSNKSKVPTNYSLFQAQFHYQNCLYLIDINNI